MNDERMKSSPGGTARITASPWRSAGRGVADVGLFVLSLILLTGLFIMAPPVGFSVAGVWALYLAAEVKVRSRRQLRTMRTACQAREAELEERLEALSDQLFVLEDRSSRYQSLIEKQGDIVFRRDAGGAVSFVNEAFCRTFATTPARALGGPLPFRTLEGGLAGTDFDRPRRLSYDVLVETADGPRWIAFEDFLVQDETGRIVEVQYVGRDVTERHEAEEKLRQARAEAEAAASAKSRFLATMSHEIRTPLNGVLGMAGLLERTRLTPEQQNYLAAIHSSGEALLALIDDILDFSRLDAGKVRLSTAPFELATLCEEVVELMAPRAHAKALEIGLFVAQEARARFEGDASRLRQVLLNLVGNAVKFTDTGGVRVRVQAEGEMVAIEVTDTGPGIPQEALQEIFKEFEQAEQGPSRRYGGTGLGLAISARLVRLMRGRIKARNNRGAGATFRVELPLARLGALPRDAEGPLPRVALWTTLEHEAVLWAEALGDHGFEVECFAGYEAPQDNAALSRADILIFDTYVLHRFTPVLERTAARRLVALRPEERLDVLPRQKDLPVDGFLIRPVRLEAMMQFVHPARLSGLDMPLKGLKPSLASARVLVAEDNDINALLTEKLLENIGCEVMRVTDGLEAVEAARLGRFDLILMDLHMPHMDGVEAAAMLTRNGAAPGDAPPIVALTANSGTEDRERSLAAGMVDFIVKPVSPEVLRAALTRWVWDDEVRHGLTSAAP